MRDNTNACQASEAQTLHAIETVFKLTERENRTDDAQLATIISHPRLYLPEFDLNKVAGRFGVSNLAKLCRMCRLVGENPHMVTIGMTTLYMKMLVLSQIRKENVDRHCLKKVVKQITAKWENKSKPTGDEIVRFFVFKCLSAQLTEFSAKTYRKHTYAKFFFNMRRRISAIIQQTCNARI